MEQGPSDDPDTGINMGCILFKVTIQSNTYVNLHIFYVDRECLRFGIAIFNAMCVLVVDSVCYLHEMIDSLVLVTALILCFLYA